MFEDMTLTEVLKLIAPLIILQFGLAMFCAVDIIRKGVRNLNKAIWVILVIVVNFIGPVSYLLFGKKRWQNDND